MAPACCLPPPSLAAVVVRLAPLVVEVERCRRPVLLVSHLSTLQVRGRCEEDACARLAAAAAGAAAAPTSEEVARGQLTPHPRWQVLLAYFRGAPLEDCASFDVPADGIIEFSPHQYGWQVRGG